MKTKTLFITLLTLYFAYMPGISQVPPDSLLGYYTGEYWHHLEGQSWTIRADTVYVDSVSPDNFCRIYFYNWDDELWIHNFFTEGYGYCETTSSNYFIKFLNNDSIICIYDNWSQPPPNVQFRWDRFYGKKAYITISVNENESMRPVKVYPNPTNDKLIISASNVGKAIKAELLNIQGQKKWEGVIQEKMVIDISSFPKGVYFLKVNSGEEVFVRKIIKN